jgi:hypothetical protein
MQYDYRQVSIHSVAREEPIGTFCEESLGPSPPLLDYNHQWTVLA